MSGATFRHAALTAFAAVALVAAGLNTHPWDTRVVRAQPATTEPGAALAALAASTVAAVRETHYTHDTRIDVGQGIYDTDCSGFVGYLLQQVAPAQYALVPKEPGFPRPRAFMYQQFFAHLQQGVQAPGWSAVPRLADAQPGDILAWALLPIQQYHDTGHVMIVAAAPVANADGTFSLQVYDSSSVVHYDDTRVEGRGGVGTGTIKFQVDADGAPIAFQFGPGDSFNTTPIAIGRLTSAP